MAIEQGGSRGEISNRLLLSLPTASLTRLAEHLEPIELKQGASIHRVGSPLRRLYFIEHGFVSVVKTMQDGRTVEIGTYGNGDVIGLFGIKGIDTAPWDSIVQIPGMAWRLSNDIFEAEIDNNPVMRPILDRYAYLVLNGLAQIAACHRLHSLKQRFCRWLLSAQDSAKADMLPLTHEALALMLGVQRSGVSIVASGFQKQGVLRNNRGRITILNRGALEAEACECYETSCHAMDRLYGPRRDGSTDGNMGSSQ